MPAERAFVALGSNVGGPRARLEDALVRLDQAGLGVVAVSAPVVGPYQGPAGGPDGTRPPVWNAVAEVRADLHPEALLGRLQKVETEAGRVRDAGPDRVLDLDLLDVEGGASPRSGTPRLPHAEALSRAFVLAPWEEIAPLHVVGGTGRTVLGHAFDLRARRPGAFAALRREAALATAPRDGAALVLPDRRALARWRAACTGRVGAVFTLGALHEGHESLLRRARVECDAVLATVFVNPLQFGPSEDLGRYPRTFDADLDRMRRAGVDAVYAPDPSDLYPEGFATHVVPEGPAQGLEGEARPGHFRGVATVVFLLWGRARPDRAYFGEKDAQQLAVVRRMVRDLDLAGEVVACPTVREADGLARSSRNRYLDAESRERARALPAALEAMARAVARGAARAAALAAGGEALAAGRLDADYLEIVDPDTMAPVALGADPVLAVAAVRVGGTRLIDARWLQAPTTSARSGGAAQGEAGTGRGAAAAAAARARAKEVSR